VGIRPGEKLHEEMITTTDALNTVEFEKYYAILPAAKPSWNIEKFIQESNESTGKMVSESFCYNSGSNKIFLTIKELQKLISSDLHE
jgi:FlaA1/EpsC-like NDP-sugar epimerase